MAGSRQEDSNQSLNMHIVHTKKVNCLQLNSRPRCNICAWSCGQSKKYSIVIYTEVNQMQKHMCYYVSFNF